MDCGEPRHSLRAAASVGPKLEGCRHCCAPPVWFVPGVHGTRSARQGESAVRPAHRADSPPGPSAIWMRPASIRGGYRRTGRELISSWAAFRNTCSLSTTRGPSTSTSASISSTSLHRCFTSPRFLLHEELREIAPYPCHSLRRRVRPWQRACYRGRHRTAGSKPALLPPAARKSRLPAAAVSAGAPAPESEADALRHRRSAASLLVSIRVSQHERHTQRGCRARVQRAGCAVARCVVRNLFRTPVLRGPSTHLRERGGRHRIRDRGVLESGCADRCRRHARRQLDGSRRVQVEDRAVAPGAGSGAGPKGGSVPQHPGRDAWPPLLRAPQGRGAIALSAPHGACPHAVRGAGAVVEQALVVLGLLAAKLDHRVVHLSNVDDSAAHLLAQVIDRAKQTRTEIVVFGFNDRIRGPLFAFDVLDRIPDDRIVATEKEARDLAWSLL